LNEQHDEAGRFAQKAYCSRGHERTPENTTGNGNCRICNNERKRGKRTEQERKQYGPRRDALKLEVLTYYGPAHKLQCAWEGCTVNDIDMLTLDHINNDGYNHLKENGQRYSGHALYGWVKKNKFPEGFQTLCCNHQSKKYLVKCRSERYENTVVIK